MCARNSTVTHVIQGGVHHLERVQVVPRPRADVFAFFADAANLEALTPPFLQFQILTPLPIVMQPGALIDYQLKLYGVPLRWRTLIEDFVPGSSFVDTQLKGPYKLWHHTHSFRDVPGGTEITDSVDYTLPLWPLSIVGLPLVKRSLRQIFDYRTKVISERFG